MEGSILDVLRGREPRTIPTKDLPRQVVFFFGGGVVCELSGPKRKAHCPSFALAMLIVGFVGAVRGFHGLIANRNRNKFQIAAI